MNVLTTLRDRGHKVELIDDDHVLIEPPPPPAWVPRLVKIKPELIEALKAEQQARREDLEELFHERAAIAEYDGGLSREEAEELAVRTVWRWAINTGDAGTYRSTALTYDEARAELEQRFHDRKVTHLEFISAIAEGFGFVAYRPEIGETAQ